jgi:hypothetical protein
VLAAGCGGSGGTPDTAPAPPPSGTGYFVGSQGGIGASLDLLGEDPVSRAVDRALLAEGGPGGTLPEVGIASIVNETPAGFAQPRLVAILESGRAVILTPAAQALRGAHGPAARAARERLRVVPRRVPGEGAAVAYVVLRGASADEVASVLMAAGPEQPITLAARRR